MKPLYSVLLALLLAGSAVGQVCYDQYGNRVPCGQDAQGWQPAQPAWGSASAQPPATPKPWRCRVHMSDGSTGSGSLIGPTTVLTNWHVVRDSHDGMATCVFPNGQRATGRVTATDQTYDLASIEIGATGIEPAEVSTESPTGTLTAGGFGSDGTFQIVRGPVGGWFHPAPNAVACPTIVGTIRPGDSGGGVVNERKQLVGVMWGCVDGEVYITSGQPLRRFLDRVLPNRPGAIIPRATPQPHVPTPGCKCEDDGLVPVQPIPNQPNPEDPEPQTDGDGLRSLLVTLNQNVSNLSVKVEQIGNCECEPTDLTDVNASLKQISLTQQMILAKCGQPTPQPDADIVHYVLVADEGASYWRRVNDTLRRAREAYSQIRLTPPPEFPVGELPQLVAYADGKPLGSFKGQRDVENALTLLTKGEIPKP